MRKNIIKWGMLALMSATAACNIGCSDDFLEEKKLYGKDNEVSVYSNYITAVGRIDNLYYMVLPGQKEGNGRYANMISTGTEDDWAKTTEEYGGVSKWEDSSKSLTYSDTEDHFYVENKEISPYGQVREINEFIENLQKYGKDNLEEWQYNGLLGQAHFLRAWRYYLMVKWYGGVPIIDHVQAALVGNGEGLDLVVPRSSTKECIDFICGDLDKAAKLLPLKWEEDEKDWGRVTAGTALAVKGRILLHWASPLWNRKNDLSRWEAAFAANDSALKVLNNSGYGLAFKDNAGSQKESAANWGKMFLNTKGTDGSVNEAVFVTLYNNVQKTNNNIKWNSWEEDNRPKNTFGGGGKHPTAEMVDLFPMADGKKAGESEHEYDKLSFFMNRDPRFYRTFAFPGVRWFYKGQTKDNLTTAANNDVTFNSGVTMRSEYPYNGGEYVLWSYAFYANEANMTDPHKSGYGADGLGSLSGRSSVYIRKRSDDLQLNGNTTYIYAHVKTDADGKGFSRCALPYMEMRYAEVLLNYAEAAAAINKNVEAFEALKMIRSRVYDSKYEATNYGLEAGMTDGRLIAAILYERQIELAYEGKRFEDMRRWLLFDGGVGHEYLGANFKLTGWGGNTCAYLGLTPTNGRAKYHYIEIYAKNKASGEDFKSDPILAEIDRNKVYAGLNLLDREKNNNQGEQQLKAFYETYFERKDRDGEGNESKISIFWQPNFYIMGLGNSAMINNPTLYQNIGWEDTAHGGNGIFDPLEEDPAKIPVDTDTGYSR
ncbi:RagB/SusD family nutrient uptake outer membrane protein [Bacteroides sp. 224]|uniref:RagB/SusD family nutrient uptake outer membrane protein n=1 Tax=Bacteroides sp. 224 TaxID=2302936 RepID=UPI0013D889CE|nr:RagB/SusD family nutrient uptake outer membrane protein [Bacteroides sp. 224]NDV64063.1 RagB/SusD family nutrient uptake outer membrane protein [Bacteroides sp. 224]